MLIFKTSLSSVIMWSYRAGIWARSQKQTTWIGDKIREGLPSNITLTVKAPTRNRGHTQTNWFEKMSTEAYLQRCREGLGNPTRQKSGPNHSRETLPLPGLKSAEGEDSLRGHVASGPASFSSCPPISCWGLFLVKQGPESKGAHWCSVNTSSSRGTEQDGRGRGKQKRSRTVTLGNGSVWVRDYFFPLAADKNSVALNNTNLLCYSLRG